MAEHQHSQLWQHNLATGNANQHNGDVHGNVYNNHNSGDVYLNKRTPYERLLDSLYFPGIDKYLYRPLESYPGTYQWLLDEDRPIHSCGICDYAEFTANHEDCVNTDECLYWEPGKAHRQRDCCLSIRCDRVIFRENVKFRTWVRSSQEIFWISGKAGAGKSCLMKFLLEHEDMEKLLRIWAGRDREVTLVGFFFWAAGNELERSQIGLLRSLLRQILLEHPQLAEQVHAFRDHISHAERPWTYRELHEALLKGVAEVTRSSHLALFIDGLDEFQGDVSDLTDTLSELNRLPQVKICVSSRPWNVFHSTYGSQGSELFLELHNLTRLDIDSYIKGRLEAHKNFKQLSNEFAHVVVRSVRHKAEGVFYWVTLVCARLRNALDESYTGVEMLEILQEIPIDLDTVFKQSFDSIDPVHRKAAARTFLSIMAEGTHEQIYPVRWLPDLAHDTHSDLQSGILTYSRFQELEDEGAQAARRWCKDLIQLSGSDARSDLQDTLSGCFPEQGHWATVGFPHRTVHDFIAAKKADGTLQRHAGVYFCSSYAAVSILMRHARGVAALRASRLDRLGSLLLLFGDAVEPSAVPLLVESVNDFNALGQTLAHNDGVQHWTFYSDNFMSFLEASFDSRDFDDTAILLAFILCHAMFNVFQHMLTATPQCATKDAKLLWLSVLIFWHLDVLTGNWGLAMGLILELGVDVNEPWPRFKHGCTSLWIQYLLYLHGEDTVYGEELQLDDIDPILDFLMQYGADPDALLPTSALYMFCDAQKESSCKPEYESGVNQGFFEVFRRAQKMRATPGIPEEYIPATSAFEVPGDGARYCSEFHEEYVTQCFPVIKEKLKAASQAKAVAAQQRGGEQHRSNPPTWLETVL